VALTPQRETSALAGCHVQHRASEAPEDSRPGSLGTSVSTLVSGWKRERGVELGPAGVVMEGHSMSDFPTLIELLIARLHNSADGTAWS